MSIDATRWRKIMDSILLATEARVDFIYRYDSANMCQAYME